EEQAKAIEEKLNAMQNEYQFHMYIGLKHIEPFIEDAVQEMSKAGIQKAASIVLAPHYSTFSVKSYNGRAQETADKYGIELVSVEDWYDEAGFIQYWADQITDTYDQMSAEERENAMLIVSAHSLPEKILQDGDPYVDKLPKMSRFLARKRVNKQIQIGGPIHG